MLYDALYIAKLRFRYGQSEQRAGDICAFVSRVEVEVLGHESALAGEAEKFRVVFVVLIDMWEYSQSPILFIVRETLSG